MCRLRVAWVVKQEGELATRQASEAGPASKNSSAGAQRGANFEIRNPVDHCRALAPANLSSERALQVTATKSRSRSAAESPHDPRYAALAQGVLARTEQLFISAY